MDLDRFLQENSYLQIFAEERDESEVLQFMAAAPMRVGGIELIYDRSPKFQKLLKFQSDVFLTLVARHDDHKILGIFSVSIADKYIGGKKVKCAYIGDFRTDNSRASSQLWRKHYAQIIQAIRSDSKLGQPQFFLTAILEKNKEALRSLARSKKDFGFRYDFVAKAEMVNVYGLLPGLRSSTHKVAAATAQDGPALCQFIEDSEKAKVFGTVDFFNTRKKNWPEFDLKNFLLIKDGQGKILACTLPYNPNFAKRMKVNSAPALMEMFFKLCGWFGLRLPQVGESLETIYLTHLHFSKEVDSAKILYALLAYVNKQYPASHMISFADLSGFSKKMPRLFAQRMGVLLFNVSLSREPIFPATTQVAFEMALV